VPAHKTFYDRREQRLLAWKSGVDGRLSGAGGLGDFVDARALEAAFEKHMARRIEDSLLDLAGMFARRAAAANHGARPFGGSVRFRVQRASFAKTAIAKICAHAS
jgi:hypothetical protein